MPYTRRHFGKITLAAAATRSLAEAAPNSRIHSVQIGAITYGFRQGVPKPEIIPDMVKIGLSEVELMSGDAEALAGAPLPPAPAFGGGRGRGPGAPGGAPGGGGGGRGRAPLTPEQIAARDAQ